MPPVRLSTLGWRPPSSPSVPLPRSRAMLPLGSPRYVFPSFFPSSFLLLLVIIISIFSRVRRPTRWWSVLREVSRMCICLIRFAPIAKATSFSSRSVTERSGGNLPPHPPSSSFSFSSFIYLHRIRHSPSMLSFTIPPL